MNISVETICEIIHNLLGDVEPIGETNYDNQCLENLKNYELLILYLVHYIYSCLKFRNRHEKSMNTIGLYAENILFRWNHELDQLLKDETDEK